MEREIKLTEEDERKFQEYENRKLYEEWCWQEDDRKETDKEDKK